MENEKAIANHEERLFVYVYTLVVIRF